MGQSACSSGGLYRSGSIDDRNIMLALSIRQPFAELILRGIKTVEYRSRSTQIIGRRFWIYASKGQGARGKGQGIWSQDLSVANPPAWMIELAEQVRLIEPGAILPTGVIVGSAVIERCEQVEAEAPRHEGTEARSG